MLRLENASLMRGNKLLFHGATLQFHRGQRVGIVGVNGCGKSSLFALILGELETESGEIHVSDHDEIAHVEQQSPSTDQPAIEYVMDGDREFRATEQEIVALEAAQDSADSQARLHELRDHMDVIDGYTARSRAARLISGLGFAPGDEDRPVNEFSGGWRMRLNLAQALMCRSDILLLDEPTNHLDLPAILWLERWLQSYEGILLVISHDRDFLDGLCTHIAHFEREEITSYTGNYSQFERIRSEQLALQQTMHEKQQREIAHIQSYVDRFRYKASKAKQAQSRLKMLERMTRIAPAHVDSQFHFEFLEPEQQPQHLLSLENVTCGYDKPVVSDVNLTIAAGSRIGLLGVNGAGKSTLLKTLVDGSTVLSGDRVVHQHTRIGYFAQHQLELLRMDCSPLWHVRQQAPQLSEQELRNHLGKFGFGGERVEDEVRPFSGGEKSRLVLAVMILQQPNLLLLDEPTNHLDLEMRHALSMALVEYSGALLVISHDRHLLRSVCDELFIVSDGELLEFREDLDHYPDWLKDRASLAKASADIKNGAHKRKDHRRNQARLRELLQPLRGKVRDIEQQMARHRVTLEIIEKQLADETLYIDSVRKDQLSELVQQQGLTRKAIETLEWEWLEASEQLEKAQLKHDVN